jgi:hypothetical protein
MYNNIHITKGQRGTYISVGIEKYGVGLIDSGNSDRDGTTEPFDILRNDFRRVCFQNLRMEVKIGEEVFSKSDFRFKTFENPLCCILCDISKKFRAGVISVDNRMDNLIEKV